jgi:hypothetical protein
MFTGRTNLKKKENHQQRTIFKKLLKAKWDFSAFL